MWPDVLACVEFSGAKAFSSSLGSCQSNGMFDCVRIVRTHSNYMPAGQVNEEEFLRIMKKTNLF